MTEPSTNYATNQESNLFTDRPVVYGSFWQRFAAALIDGIILGIVGYLIAIPFGGNEQYVMNETEGFSSSGFFKTTFLGTANLISTVINWLYYAIMESGTGQATLGKKALGLKVTDLNGNRISFLKATGRYFGKIVSAVIIFIGYLMMLWDDKKQTLHDKMAGTLVVKA